MTVAKDKKEKSTIFRLKLDFFDKLRVGCTNDDKANLRLTLEFNRRYTLNHSKYWSKCWIYFGL